MLLTNLAAIGVLVATLWLFSLARRDAGIVNIFWGFGYVFVAWISYYRSESTSFLLPLLVTVWGCRLAAYLTWRNWGKPEDYRYTAMREHHGQRFWLVSLFTVFMLQGALIWIISLPIQVGMGPSASSWPVLRAAGVVIWLTGLMFEAVGDYQLARFKSQAANSGQVMNRGLWRYTRHPNYFGDFLVWWGFYLVAVEPGSWWWTIIGPALMSFLLLRVSGVKLLEKSLRSRVEGYQDYVRRTSSFWPWPPKTGVDS